MSQLRNARCSACGETLQVPDDEDRCRLCGVTGKLRFLDAPAAVDTVLPADGEATSSVRPPAAPFNALALVGGLVTVLGIFLMIGNMTGLFPTFPMAGYITIVIGGLIAGAAKTKKKA